MKIYVCVKQVPDTSGKVAVKPDGTLDRGSMQTIINPDDLNAAEAALTLRDGLADCTVTVLTMGPPAAQGMLRELLAMGVDEGVLVTSREFGGSDTYATSQILAAAVDTCGLGPQDIVFAGRQAIDGDTAQVGPQIAEKLHIPQITCAQAVEYKDGALTVRRALDGVCAVYRVQTPCLITCVKELNTPRYMTVLGTETCFDKPITVISYETLKEHPLIEPDTIGLKGSPTNIFRSFTPPQKGTGVMLEGTAAQAAGELAGRLFAAHLI